MPTTATHHVEPSRSFFSGLIEALSNGLDLYIDSVSRSRQVEALHRKSDAELARMGLKREDIVRHVFRDKLYI